MKQFLFDALGVIYAIAGKLAPVVTAVAVFFQPIWYVLVAVGGFILLDTAVARYRVYHFNRKLKQMKKDGVEPSKEDTEQARWTSRRLRMGLIPKMLSYQLVVCTFFFLDYGILNEFINLFFKMDYFLTKIMSLVLIYIEVLSIDESFKIMNGKSIFTHLINMIKHFKKVKASFEEINPAKKDKQKQDIEENV